METPKDHPSTEHPTLSTECLAAAQTMDPLAWSRLVHTFGPIVYRWCRCSGVPPEDASDVVQEVFTSVARGIGEFERRKAEGSFRSWLATITRNRARDYFRRQASRLPSIGGSEALERLQQHAEALDSSISADDVRSSVCHQVLRSVQAEFEPATWQAFWLTTIEDKSTDQAAEQTGLSKASIYQAKSRVLRRLRQRMSDLG